MRVLSNPLATLRCHVHSTSTNSTNVVWTSVGTLPSGPFYGWFGITFSDSLAVEYKKALERLKRVCEQETKLNQAGETESGETGSGETGSGETEKATSSG